MIRRLFLAFGFILAATAAHAQSVPSGTFVPGHTVRCQNSTCTVFTDAGGAAGSSLIGQNYLTEVGITNGGTPFCINDALISAVGGYHQLCLGANALGGGLISYNAYGGATPKSLTLNINGTNFPLPGPGTGTVVGPSSSTVGHLAAWNNVSGTSLSDVPTGSGVLSALGVNVGTSGAVLVNGGGLGTPSSGNAANLTGLPLSTGVIGTLPAANMLPLANGGIYTGNGSNQPAATSTGTGVITALGVNIGTAGGVLINGGVLGTPSSGTLTNATGLPVATGISGLGTGVAAALAVNTQTNGGVALLGSGSYPNGHCVEFDINGHIADAGAPCSSGGGGGSVTSVGLSTPATSIFGTTGSPITTAGTIALTTTGTSGGVPYFSSSSVVQSSGALAANGPVIGGGAGAAPTVVTPVNNAVLVTNGSGVPSESTTLPSNLAATSMALTTPNLGVATGTSLALGGAILGGNQVSTTGTYLLTNQNNNSGNVVTINARTRNDSQLAINIEAQNSSGDFTVATNGNVAMGGNLAFTGSISGANNVAPHVATEAALAASASTAYPNGVWRDDYAVGAGDIPHFYTASGSPCSLNSGAGDGGSQVPSSDSKCFLLAPNQVLTFAAFGAVGDTLDVGGITTTSSSTTISLPTGLSFSGRTGERFIGAGIGSGGNLLDTTVAGATSLTAAAGVSQSTASLTYFVSSKTPDGDASAGCLATDVLTAPAVVNGSAIVAAQITVDTVSGGHITSAHVSRGGVYTNSQPWNNNAVITFTGGSCSVGYTVAVAEQAAGNFVVGTDDTSAIANACAALATGQWTHLVGAPGKNYMTVFNRGLPIGSAGSACLVPTGATLDMNGAILTSPLWGELYGGQTVAVDASDTTIRNVDMVQWPVPMDYYGSAVVTPSGTNAIAFSAGATNSIVDNPRCNGGKSAVAIFAAVAPYGGSGTGFQTARNIKINNAKSEGCTYVFTANGGAEITLNNYIAKGVDRSLIMVATQDVHAHGSAQNVVAQDIALGQPNGDFALAGVNIEHLVRRRALSTLVNAVTNSSLVVTGVQDTSNIQFGQQISGSELQTNTLVTHVDEVGNVMLSQPTVGAPGTVSWTFQLPAWYPAAENGDFIIVSQSGQYYGNRFKITKDAAGDPSASVVNLARINNNTGTDTSDWFDNDLDLTVTNLPSGSATNCTAANGYANCLVDLFQTGFTWNSVVNGMKVSINQTGSATNPGLVHVGMSAFASALGTPLNIHDTSLLGNISYEADAPAARMYVGPVVFNQVLQTGQLYVGSGSLNSNTLSTTVAANCDSITLPAGTYDLSLDAYFLPANATTVTAYNASVSPTSATINGTIGAFQSATFPGLVLGNSTFDSFHVGPYRVTPTTNTPYYGTVASSFGTSTMQAGCLLRAARVQ